MSMMHINTGDGSFNVVLEEFFPCNKTKLKELLKIVNLDWENKEKHVETLYDFFTQSVKDRESKIPDAGKKYWMHHQVISELSAILQNGKKPNGVKMNLLEMKKVKDDLNEHQRSLSFYEKKVKRYKKEKEQFEMLLAVLEKETTK